MAINQLRDPLSKMDTIHAWLGELYKQVHKQTITAGVPAHQNCEQQEKEIIQHFKEMWDDKRYDVYCLLVSVDDPDNLFTTDEPYILGTAVPYHQETEEMDYLDEDDPEEVSTLHKILMPIWSLRMMVLPQCKKALMQRYGRPWQVS